MPKAPVVPYSDDFTSVFATSKPLIGTVHLEPLPGAPQYRGTDLAEVIRRAVAHARTYEQAGIDGIIGENESAAHGLEALERGADAITAPWPVLLQLLHDELTDSAVEQFRADLPC